MKKKTRRYSIRHLNAVYSKLFSRGRRNDNLLFVRAVFQALSALCANCEPGDKVGIVNFGTFDFRCPRSGSYYSFKTKKRIQYLAGQKARIIFHPARALEQAMIAMAKARKGE